MIALNLPYITCPDFEFDQDLYSDDFTFKLQRLVVKHKNDGDEEEDVTRQINKIYDSRA